MIKIIKQLNRLQSSSLNTYQTKYGHYQGAKFFNLLHSSKCKKNIVLLCLHLSTDDLKTLFSDHKRKKNVKLIHTVKTN